MGLLYGFFDSLNHSGKFAKFGKVWAGWYFLYVKKMCKMLCIFMISRCESKKIAPFCRFFENRQIKKKLLRLNGGFRVIKLNQF